MDEFMESQKFDETNTIVFMHLIDTFRNWDGRPVGVFQCDHCGTIKSVQAFVKRDPEFPWRRIISYGNEVCPKCLRAFNKANDIKDMVNK